MTGAEFVVDFPEFAALLAEDPALITAALARAERRVSDSWDTRRDDIVKLTAAHSLALHPWGRNARLSEKDGSTTYGADLAVMKKGHACARSRAVVDPDLP